MIGVSIYVQELQGTGTTCNSYGFYSLTLPQGQYHLVFSFMGYGTDTAFIDLKSNIKLDRTLQENTSDLSEVVVRASMMQLRTMNVDDELPFDDIEGSTSNVVYI